MYMYVCMFVRTCMYVCMYLFSLYIYKRSKSLTLVSTQALAMECLMVRRESHAMMRTTCWYVTTTTIECRCSALMAPSWHPLDRLEMKTAVLRTPVGSPLTATGTLLWLTAETIEFKYFKAMYYHFYLPRSVSPSIVMDVSPFFLRMFYHL